MLLRSSRKATALTKEALAGFIGRVAAKRLGAIGRFAMKHPVGTLATVGGVGGAIAHAVPRIQRGRQGMTQESMTQQRWGMQPRIGQGPLNPTRYRSV